MKTLCKISAVLLSLLLVLSLASCSLFRTLFGLDDTTSREDLQPTYTITYDLGNGTSHQVTVHPSDPDYVPETPVRQGYRFLYWTIDGREGQYNGVVKSGSSGDITFRAVWELIEYTLTYLDANDTPNPASYNVESNDFAIANPSKTGYYFVGWQLEDGQLKKDLIIPKGTTGDLVLTAKWSATPFAFSASANIEAPITANIGTDVLAVNTPIRVTAPVYVGDQVFSHWEINGTTVSETAFYTFPMPGKNTEIKAIYKNLSVIPYDKASGGSKSVSLASKPTFCFGGNAEAGVDLTLDPTGVTFSAEYLASLDPGDYRFYMATITDGTVTADKTFTLRVTDSANSTKPKPDYSELTGTGKTFYDKPVFTYQGKIYHRVASTEEEFRAMVEYFIFVDGVLKMKASGNRSEVFSFDFWICGDLNTRFHNGENLLEKTIQTLSLPMHTSAIHCESVGNSTTGTTITLSVSYPNGLNESISTQEKTIVEDLQKLLTSPGRAADYNSFPIDALTTVTEIRTLYELEVLPFGMKPAFAASAADAETVYNAARAILRTIIDDGMDDYAKVAAIYVWLGENVTYDTVTFKANDPSVSAYTVKGALIDRIAVCDGFASAFRLLCQIEGIRAEEITGVNELGKINSGHAWNKVWIGGAVYGVDCTWTRISISDSPSLITFKYLFLNELGLLQSNHYENAAPDDPFVCTLADAQVPFLQTQKIDQAGHGFTVSSNSDFLALVAYLKKEKISAAEFYVANESLNLVSTSEYSVTVPDNGYTYIIFQ